jgi:hypothetical protein
MISAMKKDATIPRPSVPYIDNVFSKKYFDNYFHKK